MENIEYQASKDWRTSISGQLTRARRRNDLWLSGRRRPAVI